MKKIDTRFVMVGLMTLTNLIAFSALASSPTKPGRTAASHDQLQCETLSNQDQVCLFVPDEGARKIKSFKFKNRTILAAVESPSGTNDRAVVLSGPLMMTEADLLARGTSLEQPATPGTLVPTDAQNQSIQVATTEPLVRTKLSNVNSFLSSNSLNGGGGEVSVSAAKIRQFRRSNY